jgi:hypothetical protein
MSETLAVVGLRAGQTINWAGSRPTKCYPVDPPFVAPKDGVYVFLFAGGKVTVAPKDQPALPALKAACEDALRAAGWTRYGRQGQHWRLGWPAPPHTLGAALDVLWKETR